MMCISDLNPQMQFQNLNLSSKTISPIRKYYQEPALEASTGTPHLAATRPPRAARALTKSWTENWLISSVIPSTTSTYISSHTIPSAQTTSTMATTSIQELGVTRSYEEYENEFIHRLEVEAL